MQDTKDKQAEKSAKSGARRARLGRALRANLLKRKAKTKEPSPRTSDEGRQS